MRRSPVFLGVGSNLGEREAALVAALRRLAETGFHLTGRSSTYATEPVGGPPQGWFLNAVARGETDLSPHELLRVCQSIEAELGRVREVRHGPRTLDLDILLYGDLVLRTPTLVLPHPRLHERRFVLVPLAEISPEARHPILGLTAAELRDRCPDASRVVLYEALGSPA